MMRSVGRCRGGYYAVGAHSTKHELFGAVRTGENVRRWWWPRRSN